MLWSGQVSLQHTLLTSQSCRSGLCNETYAYPLWDSSVSPSPSVVTFSNEHQLSGIGPLYEIYESPGHPLSAASTTSTAKSTAATQQPHLDQPHSSHTAAKEIYISHTAATQQSNLYQLYHIQVHSKGTTAKSTSHHSQNITSTSNLVPEHCQQPEPQPPGYSAWGMTSWQHWGGH